MQHSANLFTESAHHVRKPLVNLDVLCPCPQDCGSIEGLTDNHRVEVSWQVRCLSCDLALPDLHDQLNKVAALDLVEFNRLHQNSRFADWFTCKKCKPFRSQSNKVRLKLCCSSCQADAFEVDVLDTKEKASQSLDQVLIHRKEFWESGLSFLPSEIPHDIPSDARELCLDLSDFEISPDVISRITYSLQTPGGELHNILKRKKATGGTKCYIRIGFVDAKKFGDKTAVLELWPVGHSSPRHQHGGCAGGIKVLSGELQVSLWRTLAGNDEPFLKKRVQVGMMTWLNRQNFHVHEVSVPNTGSARFAGFALSVHLYKSCTDEFEFVHGGKAQKSNPANDLLWIWQAPLDDPRFKDFDNGVPNFAEKVLMEDLAGSDNALRRATSPSRSKSPFVYTVQSQRSSSTQSTRASSTQSPVVYRSQSAGLLPAGYPDGALRRRGTSVEAYVGSSTPLPPLATRVETATTTRSTLSQSARTWRFGDPTSTIVNPSRIVNVPCVVRGIQTP
eukprot:TRINITY_DN49061_c0_g1_i1.p1 TRINITY_DN49061_c0_g1~~TRINITY_DN49061_c0_g1_i1.p1  ORF type:complete len:504 (+),score=49.00 TRINITY_DN49061_c0_g1_i1:64-1575(+)